MQPLMEKRKFSKELKLQIIKKASENGITNTHWRGFIIHARSMHSNDFFSC
jgi:hypothetical protein